MATIAHISDLHFGKTHERIVQHLHDDLVAHAPDIIVVSGDLTQRARRRELREARLFLDSLPFARVVVPGNHDIAPLWSPVERALRPWSRFLSVVGESAASVSAPDGTAVIGLNTVDPFRFVEGGVSRAELARVLVEARRHPAPFRVLVAHHPIIETEVRPLRDRVRVYWHRDPRSIEDTLEQAGIDLVLTGHLHDAFSGPAAARLEGRNAVLAVQASTATSTRLRRHKNAWNFITIDPIHMRVHVQVRISDGATFSPGVDADWQRRAGMWTPNVPNVSHGSDVSNVSNVSTVPVPA